MSFQKPQNDLKNDFDLIHRNNNRIVVDDGKDDGAFKLPAPHPFPSDSPLVLSEVSNYHQGSGNSVGVEGNSVQLAQDDTIINSGNLNAITSNVSIADESCQSFPIQQPVEYTRRSAEYREADTTPTSPSETPGAYSGLSDQPQAPGVLSPHPEASREYPPKVTMDGQLMSSSQPRNFKKIVLACFGLFIIIIIIVIIIAIVLPMKNKNSDENGNGNVDVFVSIEQRYSKMTNFINERNISEIQLLDDPISPQKLAIDWIVTQDQQIDWNDNSEHAVNHAITRYILVVLRYALDAPTKWLKDGSHQCDWPHIVCNEFSRLVENITAVATTNSRYEPLSGKLPDEIYHLSTLKILDLSSNKLTGFGLLPLGLEELSLPTNSMETIPDTFHGMSNLLHLDLHDNELRGMIPPSFSHLINLKFLYLGENSMSGRLSSEFHALEDLKVLDLQENDFSGNFEQVFKELYSLEYLNCRENSFSGTIGDFLGQRALIHLVLEGNNFHGPISPELGNLSKLQSLELGFHNEITGKLPVELFHLTNIIVFKIESMKQLTGTLPTEIGLLTKVETFEIDNIPISGTLPTEIGLLTTLHQLLLYNTNLSGTLPSELGNLSSNIKAIWLDNNNFTEPIPKELSVLTHLFEAIPPTFTINNNPLLIDTAPTEEPCPEDLPCQSIFNCTESACNMYCICNEDAFL